MDWPVNCANCGKVTLVNDEPGEKCVWCGKSPYKKEADLMIPEERAKYEGMNKNARGKWLADRMEEIIADIRSMPQKKVLEKWPFGQSTFYKLMNLYAPELLRKPTSKPKKREDKKPPVTVMADYPYQATIAGNENLPTLEVKAKFDFLREMAERLKTGQHIRLILPATIRKTTVTSVWYAIKGKGSRHSSFKRNGDNYACYLWFGSLELSATSKLLRKGGK